MINMAPSTYQNERKEKDCARRQKMDERRDRKRSREWRKRNELKMKLSF